MVQTVWWGHCDLRSCVESIFNKSGILERISQKNNNWKLKPIDMDLQWFGCSFFVYFEGLFSEHGLPSALRKVLGFFSLLVGLDQLSFLFWEH